MKARTLVSKLINKHRVVLKNDSDFSDDVLKHNNLYIAHKNGRIIQPILRLGKAGNEEKLSRTPEPFVTLDLIDNKIIAQTFFGGVYEVDMTSRTAKFQYKEK